jgi:hypothetical protein
MADEFPEKCKPLEKETWYEYRKLVLDQLEKQEEKNDEFEEFMHETKSFINICRWAFGIITTIATGAAAYYIKDVLSFLLK